MQFLLVYVYLYDIHICMCIVAGGDVSFSNVQTKRRSFTYHLAALRSADCTFFLHSVAYWAHKHLPLFHTSQLLALSLHASRLIPTTLFLSSLPSTHTSHTSLPNASPHSRYLLRCVCSASILLLRSLPVVQ